MKEKNIQELAVRMGLVTVEDMCQYTVVQLVVMIANKVNELVNDVWRFESDVQEILQTQNDQIQYLLSEGLPLEVEKIFNSWLQDGTFETLINQTALKGVNDRIDETNAQLSELENNINLYRSIQSQLLSNVIERCVNNLDLSICCQGDSMTAGGQDGGGNYPSSLQDVLQDIAKTATIKVVNHGCGGDTTKLSYERWNENPNCHVHLLMLGTNDKYAGLSIDESFNYYLKIIKRILDWGSAVIILTPPRKWDYDKGIMSFNHMVKDIANALNIPIIDTVKALEGQAFDDVYMSDTVHYNSTGYYIFATYIASYFIGGTLLDKNKCKVSNGNFITMDGWKGYMRVNGIPNLHSKIKRSEESPFGVGLNRNEGTYLELLQGEQLNIVFDAQEDNLYLFPYFKSEDGAICEIYLNYRSIPPLQPCRHGDEKLDSVNTENYSKRMAVSGDRVVKRYDKDFISTTRSGVNMLYVKNTGTGTLKFMGFHCMSVDVFNTYNAKQIKVKSGVLTTTELTGRIDFDEPFTQYLGVSLAVEEFQSTHGVVTHYNPSETGFNYNVNQVGVRIRWIAFGY